jgi:hypothetical protein
MLIGYALLPTLQSFSFSIRHRIGHWTVQPWQELADSIRKHNARMAIDAI